MWSTLWQVPLRASHATSQPEMPVSDLAFQHAKPSTLSPSWHSTGAKRLGYESGRKPLFESCLCHEVTS